VRAVLDAASPRHRNRLGSGNDRRDRSDRCPGGRTAFAVTDASGAVIGWYAVTVTAAPTALATTGATAPFGVALAIAMLLVLAGAALVLRRRPARG
jgi:hypothetical protein